jgi:iron complex outermembrane receptor protein
LSKWQFRASAGKTNSGCGFTERYKIIIKHLFPVAVLETLISWLKDLLVMKRRRFFATKSIKISSTIFSVGQSYLIDWVQTPYADMPRKDNLYHQQSTYALS